MRIAFETKRVSSRRRRAQGITGKQPGTPSRTWLSGREKPLRFAVVVELLDFHNYCVKDVWTLEWRVSAEPAAAH